MITVISLGAGVQSSTMALMASAGLILPMPECAIFADAQGEPEAVYRWLDWLEPRLAFPVHRVTEGNLREAIGAKRPRGRFRKVPIPAFTMNPDGTKGGLLNRSCTQDYKIRPINRELRRLCGLTRKRSPKEPLVEQWIGISTDEATRMKDSRFPWIKMRWPLIELGMSRTDCLRWMSERGYPQPPKSACIFCPYHAARQWQSLTPEEFEVACIVDESLRAHPPQEYRTKGTLFLHRSCRPLRERPFGSKEPALFDNECAGVCGV